MPSAGCDAPTFTSPGPVVGMTILLIASSISSSTCLKLRAFCRHNHTTQYHVSQQQPNQSKQAQLKEGRCTGATRRSTITKRGATPSQKPRTFGSNSTELGLDSTAFTTAVSSSMQLASSAAVRSKELASSHVDSCDKEKCQGHEKQTGNAIHPRTSRR